ncbi:MULTISPECIES: flagellar motor switch protein FliN [unclassified Thioalkalivibrio]|uniref:flagellar motor switch protein FliN n=1 Tax=unclassified Thioalkalivibrio TaxID=2621013 RepID=UPI0003767F22|nr:MULTISPECIES: flagellar motor switch protein FliN [unclassified Thioalkalivibrio]
MADTDDHKKDDENQASEEEGDVTTETTEQAESSEAEDDQDALADEWAAALAEQKDTDGEPAADPDELLNEAQGSSGAGESADALMGAEKRERRHKPDPDAEPLKPEELAASAGMSAEDINLQMVLDVPVTISMEIGRSRIPIRNLLQLNQGSVVELDRLAGEPLDVLVNGTLIAHGEVVVVNEKFGIRLTDVISPSERIRKLK